MDTAREDNARELYSVSLSLQSVGPSTVSRYGTGTSQEPRSLPLPPAVLTLTCSRGTDRASGSSRKEPQKEAWGDLTLSLSLARSSWDVIPVNLVNSIENRVNSQSAQCN
jgi:hypothetical protein